jgi:ferric-dicitrate binding protein FerR (iron transport regulator)
MDLNQIKLFVQSFYNTTASKRTTFLFWKWYKIHEEQIENSNVLEEIWDNTPNQVSTNTMEDYSKIIKRINKTKTPSRFSLYKTVASYAAIIIFSVLTSVFLTHKLTAPAALDYTQFSVEYGKSKKIKLEDGTVVTVNAGSTLIYPKKFSAKQREVYLSGEANFNVAKNPEKPFVVKTKHIDVTALGTRFCVQCYPGSNFTKATLVEGSIKIDVDTDTSKSYILKPNEQLSYSHLNNAVDVLGVDASKIASWEDGYLVFQGANFDEIAQTIERKYNVLINYDGLNLDQHTYYVRFDPNETIDDVMKILTLLINNSDYKIQGTTIFFYVK